MGFDLEPLLEQFLPRSKWTASPHKGGMNNTTYLVRTETHRYMLRIYETHRDLYKVRYEHHILCQLGKLELPFGIPRPVAGIGNETVKYTRDGKPAALFHYLEGINPDLRAYEQLKSFGCAAGSLTNALENMKTSLKPVYRPYYEIENTHPRCSVSQVIDFCGQPSAEFEEYKPELAELADRLSLFIVSMEDLKKLPHQLVHGDLNGSNVLADRDGNITALLDFEFVTRDLRVMELSVCLSEIINMKQSSLWGQLEAFLEGYGRFVRLSEEEARAIPSLIMLRRLDVFIHFLGRYLDGVDGTEVVSEQIKNAALQARWLSTNGLRLRTCINSLVE
ncbi:homoserine kinase [Ruminiclostridium hungatei]|uniref:Homoserine kinase n=1 Tax=Ruminiclostridium hungatei TaxID=48256 RepID=A0A1V4SM58_RUMHU|nr:phosphotransferase [Ruminiclostridium hungatei]OPX44958.1 homoserine kinase [Ruminiclostridium hungatei]